GSEGGFAPLPTFLARLRRARHCLPSGEDCAGGAGARTAMIYREAGQFKTTYAADQAIFPIVQDRVAVALAVAAAFVVPPLVADEYWLQAVLIPFLIYALAALGLNVLTGYAGQLSLGTGGFMAVGAYAAFKLTTAMPQLNILLVFVLSGLI